MCLRVTNVIFILPLSLSQVHLLPSTTTSSTVLPAEAKQVRGGGWTGGQGPCTSCDGGGLRQVSGPGVAAVGERGQHGMGGRGQCDRQVVSSQR